MVGQDTASKAWRHYAVISFLIFDWFVVIIQFFTGSDILRWRSFYSTHDSAWKAYYSEVFDHGIREALCCLGRAKYLYAYLYSTCVSLYYTGTRCGRRDICMMVKFFLAKFVTLFVVQYS